MIRLIVFLGAVVVGGVALKSPRTATRMLIFALGIGLAIGAFYFVVMR